MKLLELSQYADSLWKYAQNKLHYDFLLSSEGEDLQEARLEESITGEEGLYRHLQSRFEEIREKDEKLNCESVFNDFYTKAAENDKYILNTLIDKYTDIVLTDDKDFPTIMNANLAYQFTRFLRDCGSLEISTKEFTAEDIDLLISGGKHYYKKLVESGYDYNNEGFIKQPTSDIAKKFLDNDNIKKEQQKIPAVLIEVDRKGYLQRYALTPKEFRETFAERLGTDMPTSQDKWQIYELRPMVQLWYCNATVGDELWNTFFTDMEYGLSEGDIESGNLATVEHSEMKLLSPYVPVKTGHDSPVYYTVQAADSGSMEKKRLFVDMDGTLAVFTPVDELETLYQKGYFLNQAPQKNVVAAVKEIIKNNPEIEVNILSAYLSDSKYALDEKNQWLDQHLPEIDQAHRIFLPCGKDKKEYIPGGIRESDILLDDYTKNLNDWQPPARGIKLLNDINHTRGSWQHDRIRHDRNPDELADAIMDIMDGKRRVFDFSNQYQHINPSKVLCFDVETTGLNPNTDEIIQLSIMDGNGKTLFNEYVRPKKTEEWADAQAIHGISPEDVKDKETFDKHLPKINRIFNNAELLVGYNHEWFDIPFLKNSGVNIADDTKTFDVMHQFSPIYGQWDAEKNRFKWQKLSTCAEYYGYQSEGSFHDSLEDVRATLHCYQAMTNSKPDISAQKTQPSIKRTASRKTASIPHMTENLEK